MRKAPLGESGERWLNEKLKKMDGGLVRRRVDERAKRGTGHRLPRSNER